MKQCSGCRVGGFRALAQSSRVTSELMMHRGTSWYRYECQECGRVWDAKDKYLIWPIAVRWYWTHHLRLWRFGWHGVPVGYYDHQSRLLKRIVYLGPLRIIFGRGRKTDRSYLATW